MLYEVILRGTLFGQTVINRWNYVGSGTPASVLPAFGLAYAFGAIPDGVPPVFPTSGIIYTIRQNVSDMVKFLSLTVRAASDYSPTDFYEAPFGTGLTGVVTGDAMPPTSAWGFYTNIVRTDIGRAYKRIPGVPESMSQSGGTINALHLGYLQNIANAMTATLQYDDSGNTLTYIPCVVKKQRYDTPSGRKAYRYYPTLAEQMEHVAQGVTWTPYGTVRTQNSRQYGNGI